jgi:hypothetical protein
MAKANPISPFPADIDRDAFGHWLSGFVDGEGCFMIHSIMNYTRVRAPQPVGVFRVALRADDEQTLRLIQSYWGCGTVILNENKKPYYSNSKPISIYNATRIEDVASIIVPHFDKYPLRAKKRCDYAIWREGVLLIREVSSRPLKYRPGHAPNRHGGTYPKWTDAERERFDSLCAELKAGRRYSQSNPSGITPEPLGDGCD